MEMALKLALNFREMSLHRILSLPCLSVVLVANTQGAIGYMIQQSLQNALYTEDANREVVSIISQVKVDKDDPELDEP